MIYWSAFVPLLSAVIGAVVGGFVVHRLTLRREVLSVQRAQRVAFLLGSYRKLIDASNRPCMAPERRDNLESAFADIMLLGGREEIDAAHDVMKKFAENQEAEFDPVIVALRDNLRHELGIAPVALPKPFNLRIMLHDDTVDFRPG